MKILFLLFVLATGCSSLKEIEFNKTTLLTSVAVGMAGGAAVGALCAKKDQSKTSWALLGAGLGGSAGALSTALLAAPDKLESNPEYSSEKLDFFNRVKAEHLRRRSGGSDQFFKEGL